MISIIIPVYNVEKYVARCIDSIINQSYAKIEILLIDDGSTDSSGGICDTYAQKDSRIRVFHLENGGVSSARNYGIAQAGGDWICFVDSDDWLEKNAIEEMLFFVQKESLELGIFSLRSEYGETYWDYPIDELICTPKALWEQANELKSFNVLVCSPCNKLYKVSIIKEHELQFSKGIKFGEDFIFNAQYLRYCKNLGCKNIAYYHYDNSIQNSGVKKVYEHYDEYIMAMQTALENTAKYLGIKNRQSLKLWFIGERWEYAMDNCINSSLPIEKKVLLLNQWLVYISPEFLSFLSNRKSVASTLIKVLKKRANVTPKDIKKAINKNKRKVSMLRRIINKLKKIKK